MLKHFLFSIFSLLLLYSNAQNYVLSNSLKVIQNGDTLLNAWGGAMNAPQFGEIDLNLDGYSDLVLFDREDNSFTTYLKKVYSDGTFYYIYSPEYQAPFNSCNCKQWAIIQDYTCDGMPDIVCGDIYSNVHAWKQELINNTHISFIPQSQPTVLSQYNNTANGTFDLFSTGIDYPSLADMDFDGDMDFMTFGNSSNFIEWHQNMAKERFGRCDTLVFKLRSYCWGHYYENSQNCTPYIHDTTNCPLEGFNPPAEPARHTGSSILTVNIDGDTLNDMIIGDVSCPTVYALYNRGARTHAYIDSIENRYPLADVSVVDTLFPATFFVDVSNDNIKDFLVAPNTRNGGYNNFEGVQYYKNTNSNDHLIPDFQAIGWLQNTNFEVGSWASPAFFDYNNDGLQDLLVANNHYSTGNKTWNAWALLKNIGTNLSPMYEVVSKDYMDWVVNNPHPTLRGMKPALEDLDNDGDKDLFVGNYDGTLYYFRNDGGTTANANFQYVTNMLDSIDVGFYSTPTFYDLDNDGDKDLLIGDKKGFLHYYDNISVGANLNFNLVTNNFGNVKIDDEIVANTDGYPCPYFMDYDNDGTTELMIGTKYGKILMFHNFSTNPSDTLVKIGELFDIDFGSQAALAAAKLDSSQNWTFVVGNARGGLELVRVEPIQQNVGIAPSPIKNEFQFQLFPNPAKENVMLSFPHNLKGSKQISLVNVLGEEILQTSTLADRTEIDLTGLSSGFYYVRVIDASGKMGIRKLYKE